MNGCLDSGADGDSAPWMSADIRAESEGELACLGNGDDKTSPNRLSEALPTESPPTMPPGAFL
jgi:hypothetical protein